MRNNQAHAFRTIVYRNTAVVDVQSYVRLSCSIDRVPEFAIELLELRLEAFHLHVFPCIVKCWKAR
jgi:hypothetical protein